MNFFRPDDSRTSGRLSSACRSNVAEFEPSTKMPNQKLQTSIRGILVCRFLWGGGLGMATRRESPTNPDDDRGLGRVIDSGGEGERSCAPADPAGRPDGDRLRHRRGDAGLEG